MPPTTTAENNQSTPTNQNDQKANQVSENQDSEMSEEDKQLFDELNMLIERLTENDHNLYRPSLESLRVLIRSSTTSMISAPKPLKFLRPHYTTLRNDVYEKLRDPETKRFCADIVSVLAMTAVDNEEFRSDALRFRFRGSLEDIGAWGHEYVRHLTSQCAFEWEQTSEKGLEEGRIPHDELMTLVKQIVPYHMSHNAESEAIDLLLEIQRLDVLEEFTTPQHYQRVCLYLNSCLPYLPDEDWTSVLKTAMNLYVKCNDIGNGLRCALKLNDPAIITKIFVDTKDTAISRQMAFLIGRHQISLDWDPDSFDDAEAEELSELMANARLNENFLALARELDIMEPKMPEDIYKAHLEPTRMGGVVVDSARQNLASSYVNGLVNCAFGKDKLLMEEEGKMKWIYKNKDAGMMSTVATLGWLLLWDVDGGLVQIDKYLYLDDTIKAGALLACGVVNSGVRNDCDPAVALLGDYVTSKTPTLSRAALIGLGVAYAGRGLGGDKALGKLVPLVTETEKPEQAALAALSCGMVAAGTLNAEVTSTIMQSLLEYPNASKLKPIARLHVLGLALCYLGRQEAAEPILSSLTALEEPLASLAKVLCDACAYAGTGNVLKIQSMLHLLSEKADEETDGAGDKEKEKEDSKSKSKEEDKDKDKSKEKKEKEKENEKASEEEASAAAASTYAQGVAVIGVALIAMSDEVGKEMAFRIFGHLLRFGEPNIKRAVPLALAICYTSNPELKVLDTLSKFSHDSDQETALTSILALGICGAGTNNARLAAMLRQLAGYHAKDPLALFTVRLAQGLTHLGKGTLTLTPFHSDRFLATPGAISGLLAVCVSALDMKKLLLSAGWDCLLFLITPAIQPRLLMTFDTDLQPLQVSVRVGQAVDVVGQAGRPKTITGFQTHTTPVLLAHGERAELATEEYEPVSQLPFEGFVILKKNPNYEP